MVIETKFIDTTRTGKTAKVKRTKQRGQVQEQVQRGKDQLVHYHAIPAELVDCAIFTTDPGFRAPGVITKAVDAVDVLEWLVKKKNLIH